MSPHGNYGSKRLRERHSNCEQARPRARTISSASAAIRIDHHYVLYDSFRSFCMDKEPAGAKRSRDKAAFHLAEERVNVEQAVCHRPHSKTVTWLVVLLASR